MKWILIVLILLMAAPAFGQYKDDDGHMISSWGPPSTGNPVRNYYLKYEINGIMDSIIVETNNLEDSSVVLSTIGDWAILRIQAISIFDDTSVAAVSDTGYYASSSGIGPPTGVTWK